MKVYFPLLAALLLTGAGYKIKQEEKPAAKRPNIILIMADDMGYSDIGCYGGEIHTPNIDRLAAEGVRFTRMYNNAWCSPSRASLMTGIFPHEAGMGVLADANAGPAGAYQGYLNERCVTIAEVLKQSGYHTLLSGKWHLGEARPHWPVDRGFDHYFGLISGASNYYDITKTKAPNITRYMALDDQPYTPPKEGFYMTDAITGHAVRMLDDQQNQADPFFMYVAYTAPHWPLHALPEDIAKYKGKYDIGWDSLRTLRYQAQWQMGLLGKETQLSPRDPEVPAWNTLSKEQQQEMSLKMAVYAAQIDRMDQGIGKILDKLDAMGEKDNTIVIFLSDNGACAEDGLYGFDRRKNGLPPGGVDSYMSYGQSWANAGNTPFRYFKKWLHEGGIATPFVVRWPAGIPENKRGTFLQQTGHIVDVMPTLCEVTGTAYPEVVKGQPIRRCQGQSLAAQLKGKKAVPHKPVYWSLNNHKAILLGDYKLVAAGKDMPWELYNIKTDRAELHDLAGRYPDKVKQMAAMWMQWAEQAGVFENLPSKKGE